MSIVSSCKWVNEAARRAPAPTLLASLVIVACAAPTSDDSKSTESSLAVACKVVDLQGNVHDVCDGGGGGPVDAGDSGFPGDPPPPDLDAGPPPECDGKWPDLSTPAWSINKSFKKKYTCPNGKKAGLNFAFSANASAGGNLAACTAKAKVNGSFTFEPELCGRLSGGANATLNGVLGVCETPDCSTMIPLCKGPMCTTRSVTMDASAFLAASWGVGEIIPQARPFCDNGVVSCTISVRLEGQGHANYDDAAGQGACGCCPNGNEREIITANGKLTGTVTGQIDVTLGWLGHANLTVEGSACIGGYIKTGSSCTGPVSEMGGGWQLSASASGNACIGSGWLEYCRGFSAGPWTVGPGCDAPGGGEGG
jgi:hypothetical protein